MIRLNPTNTVLYDTSVVKIVDSFHRIHANVDAYITDKWMLVFVVANDPDKFIAIEQEDWLPEYGDFYKIQENANGSSENEQEAQGGHRKKR